MSTILNHQNDIDWQQQKFWRIASIGECMIELCETPVLKQAFAGDTMSTAVYLARELKNTAHNIDYITVVGSDPFSKDLLQALKEFGIGVDLIATEPNRMLGFYWVKTSDLGERSFYYWRNDSAAKQLMNCLPEAKLLASLSEHQMIYLSGITLAILSDTDRYSLLSAVSKLRQNGCVIAFDSNFRSSLWDSSNQAKDWVERILRVSDLALVSFEDERAMFGDKKPAVTLTRIQALGVPEIIVKNGAAACHFLSGGEIESVAQEIGVNQVDTTAAGDSFNAAYIAARIKGLTSAEAVSRGHKLAARVVQHHGAIISEFSHI